MKTISVKNGGNAIVDDADYETIARWKWKLHRMGYACRAITGGSLVLMHRQIMGEPAGAEVDHRNLNKLDNRRENLRLATHALNGHNRGKQKNNTSGFKGVSWDKSRKKWKASIKAAGKQHTVGRFDRIEDAIAAYDAKAIELAGEFARPNCADLATKAQAA